MKKTRITALVLILCLLLCSCSSGKAETGGGSYLFATGKSSGTYYNFGTYMAAIWDKYLGSTTTVVTTSGSVENIDMLTRGDADFGLCQSDILYYALNGTELYADNKQKGISVVASLYSEAVQIVVNADSDITSIEDLAGKTVAVGEYGTATEAAARQILAAYGITYDQITVKYQNFSAASTGLGTGNIDASFAVSALPSTNILEYSELRAVRFLPISTANASKLKKSCPFFTDGAILGEIYNTDGSVSTLCIDILLICRSNLSTDSVYGVASSLFDNLDELASAHSRGAEISLDAAGSPKVGTLHAGAKKYFDSLGA